MCRICCLCCRRLVLEGKWQGVQRRHVPAHCQHQQRPWKGGRLPAAQLPYVQPCLSAQGLEPVKGHVPLQRLCHAGGLVHDQRSSLLVTHYEHAAWRKQSVCCLHEAFHDFLNVKDVSGQNQAVYPAMLLRQLL